jgi:very-short-patch-repair endonuclease
MDRGVRVELEWRVDYQRDGKPRYFRLDLAIVDAKLAIEVDGRLEGWRTRNHVSDSRKCAVLLAQGWVVHRVPNKRLNRRDDIAEVAEEIKSILATLRNAESAQI